MNNPLHILQTLDRNLSSPTDLTVFGRVALALGYPDSPDNSPPHTMLTPVLPLSWLAAEDQNLDLEGSTAHEFRTRVGRSLRYTPVPGVRSDSHTREVQPTG